ncbi:MaoC/PaaZ C-terminal domain-containing protein [Pseudomonas piscis]|uniref:MaoC/PaaZ C-terminal domain-containing protein n=1 Tax=Pseudomonas piscis TaxID=2614538 RepID=UPI0021D5D665|nr:MaoC/PaaZ C-terminal domain-containing protein [Pseudomonas piscis]MCU7646593.1 MaoC/PaaZ C-terminal domain-containing protein [Pseudomonas piscis]
MIDHGDLYFEDFAKGQVFPLGSAQVTETGIIDFGREFDPQAFHIDPVAALDSPMGGLVASGFHTLALSFRLFIDLGLLRACSVGGASLNDVRWLKAVRPDDLISGVVTVRDVRNIPLPGNRGLAQFSFEIINQAQERVLSYLATIVLKGRES